MISCRDLSIGYLRSARPQVVQEHLNLDVAKGDLIALIGPNGCGKSTLLRTICGLQAPLSGQICFQNLDLQCLSLTEKSRLFAAVFTQNVDIEYCTVYQMVALGRSPYTGRLGRLDKDDRRQIDEALERVELSSFAQYYLKDLSDGERQRVMIAKALAQNTPLIFLDEPTSHLDLPGRISLIALLESLSKDMQKSILFSTHELELALHSARKIWLMRAAAGGIEQGSPLEMLQKGAIQSAFDSRLFSISDEGHIVLHHT